MLTDVRIHLGKANELAYEAFGQAQMLQRNS